MREMKGRVERRGKEEKTGREGEGKKGREGKRSYIMIVFGLSSDILCLKQTT